MVGGRHPEFYPLIMLIAVITGACLKRRYPSPAGLDRFEQIWLGLGAFSGAFLAAKVPFLLPGVPGFQNPDGMWIGGKTILFGMTGGYIGVELAKKGIGLTEKTGDQFVVPVAASIAIGRLACFFGGCCYGLPTELPWGITFPNVDSHPRHPTQFYEFMFHLTFAVTAARLLQKGCFREQLIKLYFLSYFVFRFLTEYLRPEIRLTWGLTGYQWTCICFFVLFAGLWKYDANRYRKKHRDSRPASATPDSSASTDNQQHLSETSCDPAAGSSLADACHEGVR
ncbi:MAG: prolipoprotein diacylglyceryl transferase [Planctomycetaceae bacterium]|nr:prolipoprotein diacylglyceryl transferase [Planctomycetaceae bacterium]